MHRRENFCFLPQIKYVYCLYLCITYMYMYVTLVTGPPRENYRARERPVARALLPKKRITSTS